MRRTLIAYVATIVVLVVFDLVWLGVIAAPMYKHGIGHLMAERADLAVAVLFYMIYAAGLIVFTVRPHVAANGWRQALRSGALFGFFAYATYNLTNLATLKDWPIGPSLLDMAWGTIVSAVCATAGRLVADRFAANPS